MDPRAASRWIGDEGFASLQFVVAAALAMVMVVGLVQVVAYQYARGSVMAALERGVRAGSVVGAGVAECRASLADSLTHLLGGEIGASLVTECGDDGETVWAIGEGTVPAWLGAVDLSFRVETRALREPLP